MTITAEEILELVAKYKIAVIPLADGRFFAGVFGDDFDYFDEDSGIIDGYIGGGHMGYNGYRCVAASIGLAVQGVVQKIEAKEVR